MADLRFFVTQEGTLNLGGSGNDTVFNLTGLGSATSIKGVDGDDLIQLTNQTTAVTVEAELTTVVSAGAGSAGLLNAVYSGAYESAGTLAFGVKTAGQVSLSAGTPVASGTIQALAQTGIQTLRSTLIQGGQGNDSIYLGDQITTFDQTSVRGGAGNDVLGTYNSGANTAGDLAHLSGSNFKGGAGNDTVFVTVSATSATDFKLAGNDGIDSVAYSGATHEANSGFLGGGAGNDTVAFAVVTASNTTLKGGVGDDTLNINIGTETNAGLINAGTGADTVNITLGIVSSTSVYGASGTDSIVVSGITDNGSNIFDAGVGNDTIFFQSAEVDTVSGASIVGGKGDDSILFQSMSAGSFQSGYIGGGAGNDTITLTDLQAMGSAGAVGATIKGGGGADSLTVSAVGAGGGSATFAYGAFAQSTLDSMDTLTFNTAAVSAGTTFDSAQILLDLGMGITTGVSGAGAVGQVSASGGFVVFSGYTDNSLTARVSAINAGYTTTGDYAVFTTDNTTRYLFVQGGTTDMVARLSNDDQLSAGLASIIRSGNTIGFGF
ncbi:calcium-binding protein [bacterium]|nr:calcium-binding protein [bacterium]